MGAGSADILPENVEQMPELRSHNMKQEGREELAVLLYRDVLLMAILKLPCDEDLEGFADHVTVEVLDSLSRFRWECSFPIGYAKFYMKLA